MATSQNLLEIVFDILQHIEDETLAYSKVISTGTIEQATVSFQWDVTVNEAYDVMEDVTNVNEAHDAIGIAQMAVAKVDAQNVEEFTIASLYESRSALSKANRFLLRNPTSVGHLLVLHSQVTQELSDLLSMTDVKEIEVKRELQKPQPPTQRKRLEAICVSFVCLLVRFCRQEDPNAPSALIWTAYPDISDIAIKYCYEGYNGDGQYWEGTSTEDLCYQSIAFQRCFHLDMLKWYNWDKSHI